MAGSQQLLQYRENLKNPPLLVVCDIQSWEIHTNFPNTEKRVYRFSNQTLPQNLKVIRALFEDPDRLHPGRNTEQVTAEAAASFKDIVDEMRAGRPGAHRPFYDQAGVLPVCRGLWHLWG